MRRLTRLHASGRASDLGLPADVAWARLTAAGSGRHWYVDAVPFVVRGAVDRAVGGEGRRWPAPDRTALEAGDRAGFWEVRVADPQERRLVLEAAVRAPGRVRLTSRVLPRVPDGCTLRQTVTVEPDGLLGSAYLLVDLPARELVVELAHQRTVTEVGR
ncbi:DUF2867 domain-containing protein [Nocardioides sp.]|uniref:DUF2867 domain-containing protein n=1 Tax=Nocardioides sp. TaxID=35761 RepID=UPI0037847C1E